MGEYKRVFLTQWLITFLSPFDNQCKRSGMVSENKNEHNALLAATSGGKCWRRAVIWSIFEKKNGFVCEKILTFLCSGVVHFSSLLNRKSQNPTHCHWHQLQQKRQLNN
jgi:hypothetical protein